MRKNVLAFCCILLMQITTYSQNIISINGSYGSFLYHTDNSLPIAQDKGLTSSLGGSISYSHSVSSDYNIRIEAGYMYSKAKGISSFNVPEPSGNLYSMKQDMVLNSFPIDIYITRKVCDIWEAGIGLSLESVNRNVRINASYFPLFEDKISVFSVGGSAIAGVNYPIPGAESLVLLSNIKLKYLVTALKYGKNRNLDNYKPRNLQMSISLGLGYRFQSITY